MLIPTPARLRVPLTAFSRLGAATLIVALLAGCVVNNSTMRVGSSPYVVGSGTRASDVRTVAEFHAVSVSQGISLFLATGPAAATVDTDANLLEHVSSEVRDGVLYLGISGSIETSLGIRVDAATPLAIDGIQASTGATVDVEDLASDALAVGASSGATIRAGGRARQLDLAVDTGSTADLRNVTAATATVHLSTGASAHVRVTDAASGGCSLSSTLYVHGSPASVDVATDITSRIERQ